MSTTIDFENLVQITSRLINLLNDEVAELRGMNVGAIEQMQDEKRELTLAYEGQLKALAEQPDLISALEPALRSELETLAKQLEHAVTENTRALNAVRDSHDRLLRAIVDAVSRDQNKHASYTANGAGAARSARDAKAICLTVDQQL